MINAPYRESPESQEAMGRRILIALVVVALAAGGWYWWKQRGAQDGESVAEAPVAEAPPAIQNPVEPAADADAAALSPQEQIAALVGPDRFAALFVPEELLRRIVVTVDNLPREKVASRVNPAKPAPGEFVVAGEEGARVLGAENFARYAPWVEMIERVDMDAAVATYRRLYPQLQAAYENLGNPTGYFNDRLIEVIDHLLETPEPPDTIALVQPNVLWEYADPELERRSAGQKLLLRVGEGNAARVKVRLREFRSRIAAAP